MSTTTTSLTTTRVAPAMKGAISEKQCPMCWGEGFPNGSGAQDRIQELEGQVHALTARASATGKPCTISADYIHKRSMNVIVSRENTEQYAFSFTFSVSLPFFQHKP